MAVLFSWAAPRATCLECPQCLTDDLVQDMNDASTSTSDHHPVNAPETVATEDASSAAAGGDGNLEERKRRQQEQQTTFLDDLIRSIDIMIYCELSILYYMDCSLFRFLVRALPHWFYFTPKPSILPPSSLAQKPYVGTIFGTNLLCILFHILFKPPAAGEASHGYLHGGLMIDFVGQQSPVSWFRLLGLDILTLALQVLMLTVTLEKQRVQGRHPVRGDGGAISNTTENERPIQDHDAEERGILRSHRDVTENFELQDLQPDRSTVEDDVERDELLVPDLESSTHDGHPLDTFYSGEHLVASLHLLDTIRTQWNSRTIMTDSTISSASSGVQTAATIAGRRITFTFRGRSIR